MIIMKALINKHTGEVFRQSDWLVWMDADTGYPLNHEPYGYALCEDAQSDDASDYTFTKHTSTDEYGDKIITYTAKLKKGWKLKEE